MEDWFSLAFVAAFIILPLVQEFLKALRKRPEEADPLVPSEGRPQLPPIVQSAEESGTPVLREGPTLPRTQPIPQATRTEAGRTRPRNPEAGSIVTYSSRSVAKAALTSARSAETVIIREMPSRELDANVAIRRSAETRLRIPTVPRVLPGASNSKAVKGRVIRQASIRRSINTREGLRTAIVLKEILGRPVGLREGSELL